MGCWMVRGNNEMMLTFVGNRQATQEQSEDGSGDGKGEGGDKGQEEVDYGVVQWLCMLVINIANKPAFI